MDQRNLDQLLQSVPNTVQMLHNSLIGAYVYPVVPTEFSNWRAEQLAWREGAVLFDQSHHMAEITLTGPYAFKLCWLAAVNRSARFAPGKAKQMIPVSHDGFVLGVAILFYLES